MLWRVATISGMIGVALFVMAVVLGGVLLDGYDHRSQFISESYALGTEHGPTLRFLGYLPSGLLIALFALSAAKAMQVKRVGRLGFAGLGVFYGIGTVVTAFFPCEAGCEVAPGAASLTQGVHNISGLLTYLLVPFALLMIGSDLRKNPVYAPVGGVASAYGVVMLIAVGFFFASVDSDHRGTVQRAVEASVLLWILVCAWNLRKATGRMG